MGFARKNKTLTKLAGINYMIREPGHQEIKDALNNDPVLKALQVDLLTILGAVRTKVGLPATVGSAPPPVVPIPTARFMGRLAFDTTTKGQNTKGDTVYKYDHAKAMTLNANSFRERIDDIITLAKQQNDMTNAAKNPNPGGTAGSHGKLPPSAPAAPASA